MSTLRWYCVTGSNSTVALYHVRSANAAAARFESEYPDEQVATCTDSDGQSAIDIANRRDAMEADYDNPDCPWCADGIIH